MKKENPTVKITLHFQDESALSFALGLPVPQPEMMKWIGRFLAETRNPMDLLPPTWRYHDEIPQPAFIFGELCIDYSLYRVTIADEEIHLTPTEYRILCMLASNAGSVMTKERILTEVWGPEYHGEFRILQVAVSRLRQKMREDHCMPKYIVTKGSFGYAFMR